ncbi:UPF0147 family protein [Candidatus Woesearchaeota archaeon]|nr:UPF0147 family protein [Candidatus Woesearchaeota archaeon]
MDALQQALTALQELEQDTTTPKNVKLKVTNAMKLLAQNTETSIKISKALAELEELSSDTNVQSYTRTQLFNIVSILETV